MSSDMSSDCASDLSPLPAWQSADGQHFYVFVYGTLRRGEINDIVVAAARHDIAEPMLIGSARVPGRLFDYGDWPGIVPLNIHDPVDPQASVPTVLGDIFYAPMALLPVLDDIEGIQAHSRGAFYRAACTLRAASGATLTCAYYPVDEASTVTCPVIELGDWIAHRTHR